MPGKKRAIKPFVIDVRHEETSDSSYVVVWTWEEALRVAGKFWEQYGGVFDPKRHPKQPFRDPDGGTQDVYATWTTGRSFEVQSFGGRPFIRIERADKALGPPPSAK